MVLKVLLVFILFSGVINKVNARIKLNPPNEVFDQNLYESVLDAELCEDQLRYMVTDDFKLGSRFLDAGIRIPRGILTGNLVDLGNYYQCLGIHEKRDDLIIEGKYCMINVPLRQNNLVLPDTKSFTDFSEFPWQELDPRMSRLSEDTKDGLREFDTRKSGVKALIGAEIHDTRVAANSTFANLAFSLAICIPKPCTTQQAISSLLFNVTEIGLEYRDSFCRLSNDKPWVAGDYVAVTIFSIIGILTLLSTCYDLRHTIILKKDPNTANTIYRSFSMYTNTRQAFTFTLSSGALECLDGIRAIAMIWIILAHTFSTQISAISANPLDANEWLLSFRSLWITTAHRAVDTFFMMSGLLVVYTATGKMTKMVLLKNLHIFYLNRILRMFPILAAAILFQISIINRVADGPYWHNVVRGTHKCRAYWWSALLHVQNYVNPSNICLDPTWYLSLDVQLHILSPIVLFWVLGKRKEAWIALSGTFLIVMAASTTYIFIKQFPYMPFQPHREQNSSDYMFYYYYNTLTRASPFIVGMILGYALHLNRGQKMVISKVLVALLWICAVIISALVLCSDYPVMREYWVNQSVISALNAFTRPAWALAIGWMAFACVHGYGGPINWILSHQMWKLPARLSYAMYIIHHPLMIVVNSAAVTPVYFAISPYMFTFLGNLTLTILVALLLTIIIDSPFAILIKRLILGGGPRKLPVKEEKSRNIANEVKQKARRLNQ